VLDQIGAGKYDLEAEKAKAKQAAAAAAQQEVAQKKLGQLAEMIIAGTDNAETKQLEKELVQLEKEAGDIMEGRKFEPADFRKRVLFGQKVQTYRKAFMNAASSEELTKLEQELQKEAPADFDLKQYKQSLAMRMETQKATPVLERYMEAVGENGDAAKAAAIAKEVEALELKSP